MHYCAVRIVTFHEFSIYHSKTELRIFVFLRIDESNDIFVPIKVMSLASHQAALLRVAGTGFEPVTSRLWALRATKLLYPALTRRTRNDRRNKQKQGLNVPLSHICINSIAHLYRMVQGPPCDHWSDKWIEEWKGLFFWMLTNSILLPPTINMHEPFPEVCVWIVQSLDN